MSYVNDTRGYAPLRSALPLSNGDCNIIIYLTLLVVLVLTVAFALYNRKAEGLSAANAFSKDSYIAARNSQGKISLTLSYFVSGCGAWVIFAVPQAAVAGGWMAVIGYCLGTVAPLLIFGLIAPTMREHLPGGFTLNEYVVGRFGPVNAVYFGLVSVFYMLLYLTAELASASTLTTGLSQIHTQDHTWWQNDNTFLPAAISPIVGCALISLFYTSIGGLPASLLTDRVQGVGIFILSLIITIAAYAEAGVGFRPAWDDAAGHGIHPVYVPTDYGNSFAIGVSLFLAVTCANMVHAGYWQRIWAAESNKAVQVASYLSSGLTIIVMVLIAVTGWIAASQFAILTGPVAGDLSFLSVPWLITTFLEEGWAVVTIIFGLSMIVSTCDTLQSGMTALLWPVANRLLPTAGEKIKLAAIVGVMVLLNVPPILLALSGQSILQLFMLADLLAAGVVAPLFLGFWKRTHPIGAFCGAFGGLVTTIVVFAVGEAYDEGFDVLVEQGGLFRRVATYAFCITPVVSALITAGVSVLAFPKYEFAGYSAAGIKTREVDVKASTSSTASATTSSA
jgi:Na+/proline symporter